MNEYKRINDPYTGKEDTSPITTIQISCMDFFLMLGSLDKFAQLTGLKSMREFAFNIVSNNTDNNILQEYKKNNETI